MPTDPPNATIAASFSGAPETEHLRPTADSSIANLFMAGDWTKTGWPATMEGAVRSGYLAAEALLRAEGTPSNFLQPDLAPDGFIAMWLGKPSSAPHPLPNSRSYGQII